MLHKIKAMHEATSTFFFPSTLPQRLDLPDLRAEPNPSCNAELSSEQFLRAAAVECD